MHLSLLYRGRLSSCNYSCDYCPFAKTYDSAAALRRDAQELARFVAWAQAQTRPLSILFTPWGEGLVRRHYREAMVQLSQLPQLRRVAIQTNLCVGLRWLDAANLDRLALWCTYHPSQVTRAAFLQRCQALRERGVRHSVGMVAAHAHMDEIEALRAALPDTTPMWLNAFDPRPPDYYTPEQVQRLSRIDPHFGYNLIPPPSFGAPCLTGESVLSVDGDGTVRRCHFVDAPLGNLYDGSFAAQLRTRSCPNTRCDCFIGYAHRPDLPFQADYAGGVLERVPATA
ncbi:MULTISPECIES: STM4011 family radical SAM protein [Xanthomonas]|uniref:STM4011 family radical SAM protein n=1 Tax=Xanthomonas TaxID=338 RepID=UPI001ADAFAFE|nr:STM4011 family radical SAM protein [Xanthomonas phaseoli]MBO9766834.1 radical SAM protein [Xanthomonas phaseoli pv. dieffenbachiae]MBO9777250.1 radical SAM protein [Xanthomonas phaseoli pv. dieffenbachiae]MBO9780492.1 radical SAM protein [Xanthomonas phaseoli pv. dieffenbachiae]MBO9796671.1 radical SAM protein [Xanthomonas phaseoli pv. dieffenbachiae]MBO9800810.1 radical SAM protein [Xanthomonas phaseoli pv. dieffenbachiae]